MKIKVIAAVLDTQQLLLYKQDGTTISMLQGDPRIRGIVDAITPIVSRGGVAEIEFADEHNAYAAFEKKTNGFVKLFRIAKERVAHLFSTDEEREQPTVIGIVPVAIQKDGRTAPNQAPTTNAPSAAAVSQIMAHATPVSAQDFREQDTRENETMVAVVDGKVVPGVEALRGQMNHASKIGGSVIGTQNLMRRLSSMIDRRGHSVQDVLRFLERGDLPVADDGSIIAYKVLCNHRSEKGTFVDCHSKNIPQKVGSVVRVSEDLVDRNRRNECSNGLHIARRGYLSNFSGEVCVLVKLAPEDVVTVPHDDPNKIRVCGYHILGVLSSSAWQKLRNNRPMTDERDAQLLLAQAISGKHVGQKEQVLVTGQMGSKFEITQGTNGGSQSLGGLSRAEKNGPLPTAIADETKDKLDAPKVDPKVVNQEVQQAKAQPIVPTPKSLLSSRMIEAKRLMDEMMHEGPTTLARYHAALALTAFKKKSKVSYGALGLTGADIKNLVATISAGEPKAAELPVSVKLAIKAPAVAIPAKAVGASKPAVVKAPEKAVLMPAPGSTRSQIAAFYWQHVQIGSSPAIREQAARDLLTHKKKVKVGWVALGIPESAGKVIENLLGS